ncbi:MAG: hypothetical protein K2Z80_05530 [Xanthobacteraceae bacterium]|nr:hypothetical protein [Xanthobacteraceae bacterium]
MSINGSVPSVPAHPEDENQKKGDGGFGVIDALVIVDHGLSAVVGRGTTTPKASATPVPATAVSETAAVGAEAATTVGAGAEAASVAGEAAGGVVEGIGSVVGGIVEGL